MFLSKFAINKPITTTMIFFVIMVLGFYALNNIPISLLPNINYPKLTVSASWIGASPEEIESKITSPIESVGSTINGVIEVSSTSYNEYCIVNFTFDRKTDINFAKFQLNEKLQLLQDKFPTNVVPKINEYTPSEFKNDDFLSYGISGKYNPKELYTYIEKYLKYKILSIPEVANVSIEGYTKKVFKIKINRDVSEFINPYQIRKALLKSGNTISVNNFIKDGSNYIILTDDSFKNIDEIKKIKIRTKKNNLLQLAKIASISEEKMPTQTYLRYNKNPQLILSIDKKPTANALKLAKQIKNIVKKQSKLFHRR